VLDIDHSISFFTCPQAAALLRASITDYKRLYAELFIRTIEAFGWDTQTVNLMSQMAKLEVEPHILSAQHNPDKIDLLQVPYERYEMANFQLYHPRNYSFAIGLEQKSEPELLSRLQPVVLKEVAMLLPSEKKFLQMVNLNVVSCFKRLKVTGLALPGRARLFDFVAQELRMLLERYPQPIVGFYIVHLGELCLQNEPLFIVHRQIISNLLRLAVYKKVIDPQSEKCKKLLGYLDIKREALAEIPESELMPVFESLRTMETNPAACTREHMLDILQNFISLLDATCSAHFPLLSDAIMRILKLWKIHPEFIEDKYLLCSMKTAMIPNASFYGVDRGEAGSRYAFQFATGLYDTLYEIYTANPKQFANPLQLAHLIKMQSVFDAMIMTLRRGLLDGAFAGHYRAFVERLSKLLPFIFNNPNIPIDFLGQIPFQLVQTVFIPAPDSGSDSLRLQLIEDLKKEMQKAGSKIDPNLCQFVCQEVNKLS
jgi:hypothetical protein